MTTRSWIQCGLLLFGLGGILACDRTPPPSPTYPVTGRVVFNEGGNPSDGQIEFRSTGAESIAARGQIQADGSFSLNAIVNNKNVEGTAEGEHAVTFIPGAGSGPGGQSAIAPVNLTEKLKVKSDGANNFTIKIAKPKGS